MMRNFKKYTNLTSIYHISKTDTSSILLISDTFIELCKEKAFLDFLKKNHIYWIIIIGNDSANAENILDSILEFESIYDESFIDIITTSFSYSQKEEIIYEFLTTSTLGSPNYQLLSLLNLENSTENDIFTIISEQTFKNSRHDLHR